MLFFPILPGRVDDFKNRKTGSCQWTRYRLAKELRPQALRLAVIHEKVIFVKLAGDSEDMTLIVDYRVVTYARTGNRSPGDEDGFALNGIINKFMIVEDPDWVGLGSVLVFHSQHPIPGG